jgi:HK97 family phage major capsid protein
MPVLSERDFKVFTDPFVYGYVDNFLPTALYESMEASSAVLRMPTRKVVTDSGETMLFPTLASHSIATQVSGQGTVLAGTDPVFANFELGAFKYGELVIVANEVVTDTSFDIAAFIGSDLGRAIGRKIGTDLVLGSGSGQPTGVATAATSAGSVTTGGSLIGPTYETLVDTRYAVNDEYRASKSAAWLFKDATTAAIRKLRDGAGGTVGTPLWSPSMIAGAPDMLLGSPVYIDHNVASMASNARIGYFADWNSFYVRQVGDVVIEVDRSRYFDTDQLGVRGKWRVDGNLADSDALVSMLQNV